MVPIHMGRKSAIIFIYVLAIVILSIVFFNCAKLSQ